MLGGLHAKGQHAVAKHAEGQSVGGRHVGAFHVWEAGRLYDGHVIGWRHAGRRHTWRWLSKRHVYCRRHVEQEKMHQDGGQRWHPMGQHS